MNYSSNFNEVSLIKFGFALRNSLRLQGNELYYFFALSNAAWSLPKGIQSCVKELLEEMCEQSPFFYMGSEKVRHLV